MTNSQQHSRRFESRGAVSSAAYLSVNFAAGLFFVFVKMHRQNGRKEAVLSKTYFRTNHPGVTLLVGGFLFVLMPVIAFRPDLLPDLEQMGPLGDVIMWLCTDHQTAVRNTFLITIVIHLAEAVLAMMLCTYMDYDVQTSAKWGISVFIHGYLSFHWLIKELYKYESLQENTGQEAKIRLEDFARQ
jgi:hypothetical protein